MAQVVLRFEKKIEAAKPTPAFTAYVEYHAEQGNGLTRHWNVMKNARPMQMKERENFHDRPGMLTYLSNMRGFYEEQGFDVVSGEWTAQVKSPKKSSKGKTIPAPKPEEKTVVPPVPGNPELGTLPPGVLE